VAVAALGVVQVIVLALIAARQARMSKNLNGHLSRLDAAHKAEVKDLRNR
jgi:hypothetical protein